MNNPVMAGLGPAIHVFPLTCNIDVDARNKSGHDDGALSKIISHRRIGKT